MKKEKNEIFIKKEIDSDLTIKNNAISFFERINNYIYSYKFLKKIFCQIIIKKWLFFQVLKYIGYQKTAWYLKTT